VNRAPRCAVHCARREASCRLPGYRVDSAGPRLVPGTLGPAGVTVAGRVDARVRCCPPWPPAAVAGRPGTKGGIPWRGCGALGLGPATGGAPVEGDAGMSTTEAAFQPGSALPRLPGATLQERLAVLYRMTPDERRAAARRGELTYVEACKWAARYRTRWSSSTGSSGSSPSGPPRPRRRHDRRRCPTAALSGELPAEPVGEHVLLAHRSAATEDARSTCRPRHPSHDDGATGLVARPPRLRGCGLAGPHGSDSRSPPVGPGG
jgi:hypothetical protein